MPSAPTWEPVFMFIEAGHTPDISRGLNSHVHLTDLPGTAVGKSAVHGRQDLGLVPPVIDCVTFADIC